MIAVITAVVSTATIAMTILYCFPRVVPVRVSMSFGKVR
jgi:hypothetical protein